MRVAQHDKITLRPAELREAARLREILADAKGHWAYDPELVRRWVEACDVDQLFRTHEVLVAETGAEIIAWASLIPPVDGVAVLDDLWVTPDWIGKGVGSRLFSAMRHRATELGATTLEWEAEPNALGFYQRMDGRYVRKGTSEWGRTLEIMAVTLGSPPPPPPEPDTSPDPEGRIGLLRRRKVAEVNTPNVRRLAALDMFGTKGSQRRRQLIRAEFFVGAAGCLGLGILAVASGSGWPRLLGIWLIGAGINYVPLALHAQALSSPGALEEELRDVEVGRELRRTGAQQFWIAVPLAIVGFDLANRRRGRHRSALK